MNTYMLVIGISSSLHSCSVLMCLPACLSDVRFAKRFRPPSIRSLKCLPPPPRGRRCPFFHVSCYCVLTVLTPRGITLRVRTQQLRSLQLSLRYKCSWRTFKAAEVPYSNCMPQLYTLLYIALYELCLLNTFFAVNLTVST